MITVITDVLYTTADLHFETSVQTFYYFTALVMWSVDLKYDDCDDASSTS